MIYENMVPGIFIRRPNRFIAHILIEGKEEICHVKNTGRCKELLLPGAQVYLQRAKNPQRKTKFDVITVKKGDRLINIDAYAPNIAFGEWVKNGGTGIPGLTARPEVSRGDSRFDFLLQAGERQIWAEVKGVTQEKDGVVMFPDAPTQRGQKHLRGLKEIAEAGGEAWAVFVVQMEGARMFVPNRETDPDFARALEEAQRAGVQVKALWCRVWEDGMEIMGEMEKKVEG